MKMFWSNSRVDVCRTPQTFLLNKITSSKLSDSHVSTCFLSATLWWLSKWRPWILIKQLENMKPTQFPNFCHNLAFNDRKITFISFHVLSLRKLWVSMFYLLSNWYFSTAENLLNRFRLKTAETSTANQTGAGLPVFFRCFASEIIEVLDQQVVINQNWCVQRVEQLNDVLRKRWGCSSKKTQTGSD